MPLIYTWSNTPPYKNMPTHREPLLLGHKSKMMVKTLVDYMMESLPEFLMETEELSPIRILPAKYPRDSLVFQTDFTAIPIIDTIETNYFYIAEYSYHNLTIYWYSPTEELSLEDRMLIQRLFVKSLIMLNYYTLLDPITFYICPTNLVKTREDPRSDFDVLQVNSGVTVFMPESASQKEMPYVCIFRREECERVMLHELIHCFHLDFFRGDTWYESHDIIGDLPIDTNYVFGETIADTLGIIWNTLINCVFVEPLHVNSVKEDNTRMHKKTLVVLASEINYILGLKNLVLNDFITYSVMQTTGAFTYYVLKAYLLEHLDELLELFPIHNRQLATHKSYKWSDTRIIVFLDWLREYYIRDLEYIQGDNTHNTSESPHYPYSLKMSHLSIHSKLV